jgi:hypothetical protein
VTPDSGPAAPALDVSGTLGKAARALADVVVGLLGPDEPAAAKPAGAPPTGGTGAAGAAAGARTAGEGISARDLRDLATALGSLLRPAAPQQGAGTTATGTPRSGWAGGGVLTDLLSTAAPRLPIRDAARLRAAYPGAGDSEIADALVARAVRLTSGVGVATGGLAAAQWFAPPSLIALPLELGVETVLVAAIEVALVGELHELYGRPAQGDARERATAYLASWTTQRAVSGAGSAGRWGALGTAGVSALRRRVTRRLARNSSSVAPLLIGATLAARSNRKATEKLAQAVLADLRASLPPGAGPAAGPRP